MIPFDPFPDTLVLCENSDIPKIPFELTGGMNYEINGESVDLNYKFPGPGKYIVEVNYNNCILKDEIVILPQREIKYFQEIEKCKEESIQLFAPISGEFEWQNGSQDSFINISEPGNYFLEIKTDCGLFDSAFEVIDKKCACEIFIPNSFSPNNDGINDIFFPYIECGLIELIAFELKIFDRWGNFVFQTKDIKTGWDGSWRGEKMPQGVYVFSISFEFISPKSGRKQSFKKGEINLFH